MTDEIEGTPTGVPSIPQRDALRLQLAMIAGNEPRGSCLEITTGEPSGATAPKPERLLDEYRVNLVELIKHGIPERDHVPGGEGWLRQGKRYLIPAAAGTGKSLAFLVIAVGIVECGGTVVILDVETAQTSTPTACNASSTRTATINSPSSATNRLRYYEWPRLSLEWEPEELVTAMAGADVVVFDSSRLALTQLGLDEDRSGDYASFVDGLLLPLAKANITTVVLDNTGHSDGERARGTKAKEDLNEIAYRLKAIHRGGIKGLSAFLRRHRESAEWAEAQRYRAHPKAAPRIEVRPGGYLVDAREEEIETQRWEAHQRSLEAQRQAAIDERRDAAQARHEHERAREEELGRIAPPGIPT